MIINLIKKDLRACFKVDIKTIAKLFVGILIFSFVLLPVSTIAIPLFLSYIFIFRSFYLDELNKTDYFFNSMPIDKEDVVYAKYVFSAFRPRAEMSIEGRVIPFIEPVYIVAVGIALVLYVVSMLVSTKIYAKKEIAN